MKNNPQVNRQSDGMPVHSGMDSQIRNEQGQDDRAGSERWWIQAGEQP